MKKHITFTIVIVITVVLVLGLCTNSHMTFAVDWMRAGEAELTLENEPAIGEAAIIKIKAKVYGDIPNEAVSKARIYCGIPDGLEFVNDKNYTTERKQDVSKNWFNSVTLYEGPMKKNETKEILFKVRVVDKKKYTIFGGVTGSGDQSFEIDLGDPEPPEWKPESMEMAGTKDGRQYIKSGVKQMIGNQFSDLKIPDDEFPPLRTELRMRTKERPDLTLEDLALVREKSPDFKPGIPFRYLIYVEKESPEVEVYCILPSGLDMADDSEYTVFHDQEGNTRVLLYSGSMRFKECKAVYFKIKRKPDTPDGEYFIRTETAVTTQDNKKLFKTDSYLISFGRKLY